MPADDVAPAASGSVAPPGSRCSFCPWPAVNVIRAHRRTVLQVAARKPAREAYVCKNHLIRGVQYVRRGY